ncbi:hypothetical protein BKA67DRAFT_416563 [Truncatella angustata]|uniref:Secreted protein n=1 Tax=Truncatella angustata TaxID=152316 RepID=A0A9P8UCX4_9PEZI|nr:uncharacterized protein BKA67DRAFT_416563 [Truncatella angustata]KAH6646790.1 hypothetical protein BKA67DRAFT_416563 [Truncatella angustata]
MHLGFLFSCVHSQMIWWIVLWMEGLADLVKTTHRVEDIQKNHVMAFISRYFHCRHIQFISLPFRNSRRQIVGLPLVIIKLRGRISHEMSGLLEGIWEHDRIVRMDA